MKTKEVIILEAMQKNEEVDKKAKSDLERYNYILNYYKKPENKSRLNDANKKYFPAIFAKSFFMIKPREISEETKREAFSLGKKVIKYIFDKEIQE
jgi:hypothetical protein